MENHTHKVGLSYNQNAINKMLTKSIYFCKGLFDGHFRIPRGFRGPNEPTAYYWGFFSTALGNTFLIYPPLIYGMILGSYDKKIAATAFFTQIGTNIASGIYEWYKHEKNTLNKGKSGLETIVDSNLSTISAPPTSNPSFDV